MWAYAVERGIGMLNNPGGAGLVLCVGLSLNEVAGVARLLRDRAAVIAAVDVEAARALLEPADGRLLSPHPTVSPVGGFPVGATLSPVGSPVVSAPQSAEGQQRLRPRALTVGSLRIDVAAREVALRDKPVHLSAREFDLLALLASDLGRVWSFAALTRQVWGSDYVGDRERLTSTVKRLRKRLGSGAGCEVRSVHGVGYRLHVLTATP